jgi:hypothetical protein
VRILITVQRVTVVSLAIKASTSCLHTPYLWVVFWELVLAFLEPFHGTLVATGIASE